MEKPSFIKGQPTIEDGPNQIQCYANVIGIRMTNDDVALHFALRRYDESNRATGVAKIYIGLAHAKRLALSLNKSIESFEEMFGEIVADPTSLLSPEKRQQFGLDKEEKNGKKASTD
ncbi:MAG: DUF3467 domain-containing protein [Proteobacteria bacterium]|nr:DUF3467 domain-containing protein [Pseudomonadota bacterium]